MSSTSERILYEIPLDSFYLMGYTGIKLVVLTRKDTA